MFKIPSDTLLIDRKSLGRILGGISQSHIIRLEKNGNLSKAKVKIGPRMVRYDLAEVKKLILSRGIY